MLVCGSVGGIEQKRAGRRLRDICKSLFWKTETCTSEDPFNIFSNEPEYWKKYHDQICSFWVEKSIALPQETKTLITGLNFGKAKNTGELPKQ